MNNRTLSDVDRDKIVEKEVLIDPPFDLGKDKVPLDEPFDPIEDEVLLEDSFDSSEDSDKVIDEPVKNIPVNSLDKFLEDLDKFSGTMDQDPSDVDQLISFLAINEEYLDKGLAKLGPQDLSIYHFEPDLAEKFRNLYLKASEVKGEEKTLAKLHQLSEVVHRPLDKLNGPPLLNVMKFLSAKDLGRAVQVSKKWREVAKLARLYAINSGNGIKRYGIKTIQELKEFCQKNKGLEFLYLGGLESLDNDQLLEVVEINPQLKHLEIWRKRKELDEKGLENLKKLGELESLHLTRFEQFTDRSLEFLEKLNRLKFLRIGCKNHLSKDRRSVILKDTGLKYLKNLDNLEVLRLGGCSQISGLFLSYLEGQSKLKILSLGKGCN